MTIKQDKSNQYYLDSDNYPDLKNARITLIDRRNIIKKRIGMVVAFI